MKSLLATLGLLLSLSSFGFTGLQGGDRYENHRVRGQIRVLCYERGQRESTYFTCSDSYLAPSMRTPFTFDSGVEADKVILTYVDSRGKTKSKSSGITNGQSSKDFNLWIWTLTQRPLLKSGQNTISYELSKSGRSTEEGTFDVLVESLPVRTCGYRSYSSSRLSDCRSGANLCARYFREMNNCQ